MEFVLVSAILSEIYIRTQKKDDGLPKFVKDGKRLCRI